MLIAWMTSVSAGVMIARYFRDEWPDIALFGQTVWFQVGFVFFLKSLAIEII